MESKKNTSLLQVIRAVLWSMIGIRGQKGYEDDLKNIKPMHMVIAGIIGTVIFIFTVLTFVNLAINNLS